jgi:hypothetical protein
MKENEAREKNQDIKTKTQYLKGLLICGIISSILYAISDMLASLLWKEYSFTAQTVSELIAIDAPTRPLVVILFTIYALLIYTFAAGVWLSAGQKRVLRIAAFLIAGKEVLGLAVTLIFPIHLRGVEGNISDILHGVLTAVGVFLCMFPAMCLGAAAFGMKFRLYSIVTMLLFIPFGVLAGMNQPEYVANLPTPFMGVWERINIYAYMVWIVVFAKLMLRQARKKMVIDDKI